MAIDKYDFIHRLLKYEKLSPIHRERIFLLTSTEIKRDKELGKNLEERVKKLEETLGVETFIRIPDIQNEILDTAGDIALAKNLSLPKYLYPGSLYKYLYNYNQNPILKSTCHEIDSDELKTINEYCNTEYYDFDKHLNNIIEEFNVHDKQFAPASVKNLIRVYLTGKNYEGKVIGANVNGRPLGWSQDGILFSWSSKELKEWTLSNKGIPPCPDYGLVEETLGKVGFEFSSSIKSNTFNKYIKSFNDLVLHFKSLFHIRQDNSLKKIFKTQNERNKWKEKVEFILSDDEFPTNIELFTDVDKLIQAYNNIIKLVIKNHGQSKPVVKLKFYQDQDSVFVSIHHINSVYGKSLENTLERCIGQKYNGLIKNQLNGMCNFYVQADFGHSQYAKINIWDNKERQIYRLSDKFEGVEHILEFQKK